MNTGTGEDTLAGGVTSLEEERFELLEVLGRGGMGEVYRAYDRELETEVALKCLLPEVVSAPGMLERFRNEIKLARKIKHVNVSIVHDLVEQAGRKYLAMEYIDGKAISDVLEVQKSLPTHVAVNILRQVCSGVHAAHREGVIHRDLKPANVMITRKRGQAMVLDFGVAYAPDSVPEIRPGSIVGSPQYMSYEQLSGKPADERSDIHALGIILFEMVTGVSPFRLPNARVSALLAIREQAPDPRRYCPGLHPTVVKSIQVCLDKDPDARFGSALELAHFLAPSEASELTDDSKPSGAVSTARARDTNHDWTPSGEEDVSAETAVELNIGIEPSVTGIGIVQQAVVVGLGPEESESIIERLNGMGCSVEVLRTGAQALQACHEREVSLVVMSASLDDMDALAVHQLLKGNSRNRDVGLVVVCSPAHSGLESLARDAGISVVLQLPLNEHAFARAARTLLS